MKILLVQPDYRGNFGGMYQVMLPEPIALELLAACVPGHEVQIVDLRIADDLDETLRSFRPQVVGVTSLTSNAPQALSVCKRVKQADAATFTVVGGIHAALDPQFFADSSVDAVVVGEGELTFADLIATLASGRSPETVVGLRLRRQTGFVDTGQRGLVKNLDSLPLPARDLTERYREHYAWYLWPAVYAVETTRGCPYRCNFCAVWYFHHGRCRLKSPERVIEELRAVPGKYVFFVDDNFLQDIDRARRIGRLIADNGLSKRFWIQARSDSIVRRPEIIEQWAKLGLSIVSLGFESFRQEELANFNKRNSIAANEGAVRILQDNGIQVWGCFIVDPAWERSDFDYLLEYLGQLRLSFHQFTVLTPIPGTGFFKEKLQELLTTNYERFDFLHSVLPTKLPTLEFYENVARLYAASKLSLADLRRGWHEGDITPDTLRRLGSMLQRLGNAQNYLAEGPSISPKPGLA